MYELEPLAITEQNFSTDSRVCAQAVNQQHLLVKVLAPLVISINGFH